jgi:predicted DNA-binding protein (MmcQ/YjbR family)
MMNIKEVTAYCLSKPNVIDGFPFREETQVFKAGEKVCCLLRLDQHPPTINVKCDPEEATELRKKYAAITAGYHMDKKHWNTIALDGSLSTKQIKGFIDQSYELVCK